MVEKLLTTIAAILLCVVIGTIGYQEFGHTEMSVMVDLYDNVDPFVAIRQIMPNGTVVKSVVAVDPLKNQYEVVVSTKHQKSALEAEMRKSNKVQKVEVRE